LIQQPFPFLLNEQPITGAWPKIVLPHVLDFFSVEVVIAFEQARIKRVRLAC